MESSWLLVAYCVLVAAASLTGGVLPMLIRMTHLRTQLLMSFVSGLMLGIAVLHLLPHSIEILGSSSRSAYFTLAGVIGMFLLLRAFHAHHHGPPAAALPTQSLPVAGVSHCAAHDEDPNLVASHACDSHDHDHPHHHHDSSPPRHPSHGGTNVASTAAGGSGLQWLGMLFGLGLHTLMDGVALAASVAADAAHGAWLGLAGLGTFLAVSLHKPLDAFSIGSVMRKEGWSTRSRTVVNALFASAAPLGAALFWIGANTLDENSGPWIGGGLAVSAGFFICIALADLLPEVHFHDHDRGKLTLALFLGVFLAIAIENLPGHQHGVHSNDSSSHAGHSHSHEGHTHDDHSHEGHSH